MSSESLSNFTSTIDTSELEVPSFLQQSSDFQSLRNEPPPSKPSSSIKGYEDIDWKRLEGYAVPSDDHKKTSKLWWFGYRLKEVKTGRHYWLCRRCHLSKRQLKHRFKEALYLSDKATSACWNHLESVHQIDGNGNEIIQPNKRLKTLDDWTGDGNSEAHALANSAAVSFDQDQFQALLYDWIIHDNISFNQLESDRLRRLLIYLNPRCKALIPHRATVSRTVAKLYDKCLGTVTESLKGALSKISLSFDLWTSNNRLALLGICAHFVNMAGQPVTSLLSLPRQKGRHTGVRIADTVAELISEFDLSDRLGWFTTDNASANKTTMDALASEFSFSRNCRWIRCAGHIFNLVGQAALLGSNSEAFAEEVESIDLEELELIKWRQKGPIGKLHNIITWINSSPQRCERFEQLQLELIKPVKPEGKKDVYGLIKDVTTRWNSFYYAAERAVYLQPAIDELLSELQQSHDKSVNRSKLSGQPAHQKAPAILADCLTNSDWNVINQYLAILKPLKDATVKLEGHIGGKFGAIWLVLPIYDDLLSHFEEQVRLYPIKEQLTEPDIHFRSQQSFDETISDVANRVTALPDEQTTQEHHFAVNIKLAWQKLDEYYSKLDNSPVYVTACVLHPKFKWRWLETAWSNRPTWIKAAKKQCKDLLIEYEQSQPRPQSPPKKPHSPVDVTIDTDSSDDDGDSGDIHSQLTDYLRDKSYKQYLTKREQSPIAYWKSKRSYWPQLSALALDLYSIAVMSDEPERVFSTTGAAIGQRRRCIAGDKVGYLMCLKAWSQSNIIQFDRYVLRSQPEVAFTFTFAYN